MRYCLGALRIKFQCTEARFFGENNLHQTAEVSQVIDEVEQLADVICNGRAVGVHSL